jgi:hypothetical protein
MATELALSSGQLGVRATPGYAMEALFTLTPGITATAGEAITALLTPYFSTVDAIEVCGATANELYVTNTVMPFFEFVPGGALASNAVTLFWLTFAGAIDDGTNLSAIGTLQIKVAGKAA